MQSCCRIVGALLPTSTSLLFTHLRLAFADTYGDAIQLGGGAALLFSPTFPWL